MNTDEFAKNEGIQSKVVTKETIILLLLSNQCVVIDEGYNVMWLMIVIPL